MAVPSNPVRIFTSGNVGAQVLQSGALDFINVLKQCVSGAFTDQVTSSVTISNGKALLTFDADHGFYPYQVIKLTGTSSTMENKEFFVQNNEKFTAKTLEIDLTGESGSIPNVVTVKLPTLGWSVIEDTVDWFSFRPSIDNRIPLFRLSKTATIPTANTRQYYEAYLARDVNLDGTLIKNYTPTQWVGSRYTDAWNVTDPIAWAIIADNDFMYFFINRAQAPYARAYDYSYHSGDINYRYSTPMICWQYGIHTLLIEDDVPREWITVLNACSTQFRDQQALYDNYDLRRGFFNVSGMDNVYLTARTPYSFKGEFGYARSMAGWGSGSNGMSYPTLGSYGMAMGKHPVAVQNQGIYGIQAGTRSFLSDIQNLLRGSRSPTPWADKKISPNSLNMGVFEVHSTVGKAPVFLTIASRDGWTSGTSNMRGCPAGIRIGCSWDIADMGEI